MHPLEPKAAFMVLRSNGWSLGKISQKLDIPRSTLFGWETDLRKEIHFCRGLQIETLQEKYIPTVEDELEHLSTYLGTVETALQKHDFAQSRPEFLLRTALQLRSRLGRLRCEVPLHEPIEHHGLEPLPLSGCLSARPAELDRIQPGVAAPAVSPSENRTKPDKNESPEKLDPSTSTPCNDRAGTVVPFSALPPRHSCPDSRPATELAAPVPNQGPIITLTESADALTQPNRAAILHAQRDPARSTWNNRGGAGVSARPEGPRSNG